MATVFSVAFCSCDFLFRSLFHTFFVSHLLKSSVYINHRHWPFLLFQLFFSTVCLLRVTQGYPPTCLRAKMASNCDLPASTSWVLGLQPYITKPPSAVLGSNLGSREARQAFCWLNYVPRTTLSNCFQRLSMCGCFACINVCAPHGFQCPWRP